MLNAIRLPERSLTKRKTKNELKIIYELKIFYEVKLFFVWKLQNNCEIEFDCGH